MAGNPKRSNFRVSALSARQMLFMVSLVAVGAAIVWAVKPQTVDKTADRDAAISSQSKRTRGLLYPLPRNGRR